MTGLAKVLVVVITVVAMYFAPYNSTTLVGLLPFAYTGVARFVPGVILGPYWKRVKWSRSIRGHGQRRRRRNASHFQQTRSGPGVNAGFVALGVNLAVTIIVSLMTAAQPNRFQGQDKRITATGAYKSFIHHSR